MRAHTGNFFLVKNTNGITLINKRANACRMDMDFKEKRLHENSFMSEQVEFPCVC